MDGLVSLAATLALLLAAGGLIGLADRRHFSPRWLLVAAAVFALNDAMLTRCYHLIPDLLPALRWNWQGKAMALAATLLVAALPAFGWRASGLTLSQRPGSLPAALAVAAAYCLFFVAMALIFDGDPATPESLAFQLTMPGLEEEPFFRGILLLALHRAFTGEALPDAGHGSAWQRMTGGAGRAALLSSVMFGLVHAFAYSDGAFHLDPLTLLLTGGPSLLLAVWLRLRTGSVLLPILLHNFGNTILFLL